VAQRRRTPSPYKLSYTQTSRDHQDTPIETKIFLSWPVSGMIAERHVALVTLGTPASTAYAGGPKLGGREKHAK
jgi:hypothetical protein